MRYLKGRNYSELSGAKSNLPAAPLFSLSSGVCMARWGGSASAGRHSWHEYLHQGKHGIGLHQCCWSMTFWCESGSADPCLWLLDPDPAIFNITVTFKTPTKMKKSQNSHITVGIQVFLTIFAEPDSKQQNKEVKNFMFCSDGCSLLRARGFSWSFKVLHGGLSRNIFILFHKNHFFINCKSFLKFSHRKAVPGSESGPGFNK